MPITLTQSPLTPQLAASLFPIGTAVLRPVAFFSEICWRKKKCHTRVSGFGVVRQRPTGSSSQPVPGQGYPVTYSRKPFTSSPQGDGCFGKQLAQHRNVLVGFPSEQVTGALPGHSLDGEASVLQPLFSTSAFEIFTA